jgi:hypothetical protein
MSMAAVADLKNLRKQQCKRCETYIPYIDSQLWRRLISQNLQQEALSRSLINVAVDLGLS